MLEHCYRSFLPLCLILASIFAGYPMSSTFLPLLHKAVGHLIQTFAYSLPLTIKIICSFILDRELYCVFLRWPGIVLPVASLSPSPAA